MAINKVIFGGGTLIDLTGDTVTAATLKTGVTAHDKAGNQITGTFDTTTGSVHQDDDGYVVINEDDDTGIAFLPLNVTSNGTYVADSNSGYTPVTVDVTPELQNKSVTPTESAQTIVPDSGYDGLGEVSVAAISNTYVGTGIARKSASDLVVSGSTVTTPAGYFASAVGVNIQSGTLVNTVTTVGAKPTFSIDYSTGILTASYSNRGPIIPVDTPGYLTSDGMVTVTNAGSSSYQLSIQSAITITPTQATQLAVSSGMFTTGSVYVDAIPPAYVVPSGDYTISSNGYYEVPGYYGVSVDLPFYDIYKSLAFRSSIASSAAGVSEWANSLSKIAHEQFANQRFSGYLTFGSASAIETYGFASAFTNIVIGNGGNVANFIFPNVYNISTGAFANNTTIAGINCSICEQIGGTAFFSCTNLTNISFPVCSSVGQTAFEGCSNLSDIAFPSCQILSIRAFARCTKLSTISFPICENIGNNAFVNCSSLTEVSFPSCTIIGSYAFSACISLASISFPICENIGNNAFVNCSSLTEASFPSCTIIGSYAFYNCYSLASISFPICENIGHSAFVNCSSLTEANFPECTYISSSAFLGCKSLTVISFPKCASIIGHAFSSCYALESVYFLGSSVPFLSVTYAFSSTPLILSSYLGHFGSIFVRQSLLESFLSAANWNSFSLRFVGLTDEEIAALDAS